MMQFLSRFLFFQKQSSRFQVNIKLGHIILQYGHHNNVTNRVVFTAIFKYIHRI